MQTFENFPFDAEENPINISQWFNGPWSHHDHAPNRLLDLSYAVDFALPVGTAIIAVKEGIVKIIRDDCDVYYEWTDADEGIKYGYHCNMLWIKDIDSNRETHYIHLAQNSIQVKKWQIVKPGDLLAYTGKSGWIGTIPHLHLQYTYFELYKGRKTIPYGFKNYNWSLNHSIP
jgi:murein DD-endopeptidase MepM/ murein hydrolase activator NlpD